MSSTPSEHRCLWMDQLSAYALTALPASEAAAMAAHLATCAQCRQELEAMNSTIDALAAWQGDLLPSTQLWDRVVERIAIASDERPATLDHSQVDRAAMGRGRAGHRLQGACVRSAARPRQHARAARARNRVSTARARGSGRAPPSGWRAVDRRQEALSRRLQSCRARYVRCARLERDRLHLRSHYFAV